MDPTIVNYLEEQRAPFSEKPLNDVDSLVLSTIAYYNFEKGAVGNTVPSEIMPLPVAVCGISHEDLYGGIWLARMGGDEFLEALLASPRFMELDVGYYANDFSDHFEKQFSAITFFLPDDSVYIAFRGTDSSLTGWKEDFNLTFMKETPSQVSARSYLEDIAGMRTSRLYVGGHSKGGNLAEYAALTCLDQTFEKIERIFNHDGPGFAFTPSDRMRTRDYLDKLSKTVPESSVFGMLMEDRDCYRAIRSSGVLFAQHATTHWAVKDDDFITVDAVSRDAAIISSTLTTWAKSYEPEKRELFIEAAYGVLSAANADTWSEFAENGSENMRAVAEAAMKLPPDMRATLIGMIHDIAPIMGTEAAKRGRGRFPGMRI